MRMQGDAGVLEQGGVYNDPPPWLFCGFHGGHDAKRCHGTAYRALNPKVRRMHACRRRDTLLATHEGSATSVAVVPPVVPSSYIVKGRWPVGGPQRVKASTGKLGNSRRRPHTHLAQLLAFQEGAVRAAQVCQHAAGAGAGAVPAHGRVRAADGGVIQHHVRQHVVAAKHSGTLQRQQGQRPLGAQDKQAPRFTRALANRPQRSAGRGHARKGFKARLPLDWVQTN